MIGFKVVLAFCVFTLSFINFSSASSRQTGVERAKELAGDLGFITFLLLDEGTCGSKGYTKRDVEDFFKADLPEEVYHKILDLTSYAYAERCSELRNQIGDHWSQPVVNGQECPYEMHP